VQGAVAQRPADFTLPRSPHHRRDAPAPRQGLGELRRRPSTPRRHGALDYLTKATVPLFSTINISRVALRAAPDTEAAAENVSVRRAARPPTNSPPPTARPARLDARPRHPDPRCNTYLRRRAPPHGPAGSSRLNDETCNGTCRSTAARDSQSRAAATVTVARLRTKASRARWTRRRKPSAVPGTRIHPPRP